MGDVGQEIPCTKDGEALLIEDTLDHGSGVGGIVLGASRQPYTSTTISDISEYPIQYPIYFSQAKRLHSIWGPTGP